MKFFKPEDFSTYNSVIRWDKKAADTANLILTERGIRVFGSPEKFYKSDVSCLSSDTHKALLVAIEELPKKDCEHEPMLVMDVVDHSKETICKYCRVELRATWEPA